jgi:hypothetical protein
MTTFVSISHPTQHRGVARFERAFATFDHLLQRLQQESTYAVLLGMFGALSLLAALYDIADASQEGHELGAWVVLWAAVFAVLVVFAKYCKRQFVAWLKADRDARMWEQAMTDYRIMADIRCAQDRSQ